MISRFFSLILGLFLASSVLVLLSGGVVFVLYFTNQTALPPGKPLFSNEPPPLKSESSPKAEVQATPNPNPTPNPTPTETLPPGAYEATVTWAEGLSMRGEPNQEAARTGGVGANEKIIVLEESQDGKWQKILTESKQEGWVKNGNTQRVD